MRSARGGPCQRRPKLTASRLQRGETWVADKERGLGYPDRDIYQIVKFLQHGNFVEVPLSATLEERSTHKRRHNHRFRPTGIGFKFEIRHLDSLGVLMIVVAAALQ